MAANQKFPTILKCYKYEIERIGRRLGFKCRPTIYEMVDSEQMSELAAYSGYPVRYHHWTHGQESYELKTKLTRFGLALIYEMVVPTHPCYAYLLDTNELVDHKAVMAHVVGHKDFFDNNYWFVTGVPDNLHKVFAENAGVIDELRAEIGRNKVDKFVEYCMSLDNLIDILDPAVRRLPKREKPTNGKNKKKKVKEPVRVKVPEGLPSYMDDLLNPPELIEKKQKEIDEEVKRESDIERGVIIPEAPVRDILGFLFDNASLEPWQREILRIIRQENHDLLVGAQTKIMNEGWASIAEAEIMVDECVNLSSEVRPFADHYSGVLRPGGINPYLLGRDLWDDIRYRWNTGRHGIIYDDCQQTDIKGRFDEFMVFKAMADKYGLDNILENPEFNHDWSEFSTLIKETEEGRGASPQIGFSKDKWVMEWLNLNKAEKELEELKKRLTKVALAEQEVGTQLTSAGLSAEDPIRFKLRYDICKLNRFDPDLDWTEEEVNGRIAYLERLLNFRKRFAASEIDKVYNLIPESWPKWAARHKDKVELGVGWEKMFEVRETHNDVSFIREFFTEDFCEKKGFFGIAVDSYFDQNTWQDTDVYIVKTKKYEKIREAIIALYLNLGQPRLDLVDANYNNNKELLVVYLHDGRGDLDPKDIPRVLYRLYKAWGHNKMVHLEAIETYYPPKKPWWDRWRPRDGPQLPDEKPVRRICRWSLLSDMYERKEIDLKKAHPVTRSVYESLTGNK